MWPSSPYNSSYMDNAISLLMNYITSAWDNLTSSMNLKIFGTIILSMFSFLFGVGSQNLVLGLLILVFINLALWLIYCAKNKKEITWEGSMQHPFRFFIYCLMIISSHLAEASLPIQIGLTQGMVIFVTFSEFIAILKTLGDLGFSIPQKLLNLANNAKDEYGSN